MKKLIATAAIAISALSCQQASASELIDEYCLDTAVGMENMQYYIRVTRMPIRQAKMDFLEGFEHGSMGIDGLEKLKAMHLKLIDLAYEDIIMGGGDLAKEVFFECKSEMEKM